MTASCLQQPGWKIARTETNLSTNVDFFFFLLSFCSFLDEQQ